MISLLRDEQLLSAHRIELLLSWQNSGFSVHNSVTVGPSEPSGTERLARYLLRPPLSLERMSWGPDGDILYRRKAGSRSHGSQATFDPMDFLAEKGTARERAPPSSPLASGLHQSSGLLQVRS